MAQCTRSTVSRFLTTAVLVAGLAACGDSDGGAGEGAEAAASVYEGKTVDLVVPYGPGGGYDAYARTMAPYLEKCLGATVVVRNEPGAGSLLATNKTAAAKPDDLRVQILNTVGAASAQIADAEGVRYDLREMSVIGRVATAADTVAVATDGKYQSFDDVRNASEPVRFVATGPGSNEYIAANVLSAIYDFPVEVITGFPGSGEARLAVISGDADAHASTWDSVLKPVASGDVKAILIAGDEKVEELPDTPIVTEFEPEGEAEQDLLNSLVELEKTGRGFVAPPNLPESQLSELREAFDCTMSDDQLVQDLRTQERPVGPVSGGDYEEQLDGVLDASPEFTQVIKDSF